MEKKLKSLKSGLWIIAGSTNELMEKSSLGLVVKLYIDEKGSVVMTDPETSKILIKTSRAAGVESLGKYLVVITYNSKYLFFPATNK